MTRFFRLQTRLFLAPLLAILMSSCASQPKTESDTVSKNNVSLRLGHIALANNDPTTAESIFRRASELNPTDPRPWIGLGQTAMAMQTPETAVKAFAKAIELQSNNAEALRGIGQAKLRLGEFDAAKDSFAAAIATGQTKPTDFIGLGIIHDMTGQHVAAQTNYRDGLKAHAGSVPLTNNLAFSLALSEAYPEAIALLEPLAKKPTSAKQTRLNLALIYGLSGNKQAASHWARQVLSPEDVQKNLTYYEELRKLSPEARSKAILDAGTD